VHLLEEFEKKPLIIHIKKDMELNFFRYSKFLFKKLKISRVLYHM